MSKNFETPRLIKRYLNRKLYDTAKSQYITLDELFKLIQSGNSVQVLDNKSNLDITYHTYMQMLFELERKSNIPENVDMLERVVKTGSGLISDYIKYLEKQLGIGNHAFEERPRVQRPTWSDLTANSNTVSVESPSALN
jgi:polyhydroxyalkanoate synthesis repressor PhaR